MRSASASAGFATHSPPACRSAVRGDGFEAASSYHHDNPRTADSTFSNSSLQPEQHMTVPDRPEPADDELLAYLLELLSAEDTERVELASIADDEVAARLRIVETDLVDGYVRGALTGATLAQF